MSGELRLGNPAPTPCSSTSSHLVELQSLRGLAALAVLLSHALGFYALKHPEVEFVTHGVLNAHASVVLFFVLSGFVLGSSLARSTVTLTTTFDFYVRRAFRIYPGLWIACAVAGIYLLCFGGVHAPDWVDVRWWHEKYRASSVALKPLVGELVLGASDPLPVAVWTLCAEMIGSIVMPLIMLVLIRFPRQYPLLLVSLFGVSMTFGQRMWMASGVYLVDFAIGAGIILVARHGTTARFIARHARAIALLSFMLLWSARRAMGIVDLTDYHDPLASVVEALAAAGLIAAIAAQPQVFAPFRWRGAAWLGDISYSLYLLHLPILGLVAGIGGELLGMPIFAGASVWSAPVLALVTIAVTLPVSALVYHWVELPGIRLGVRTLRRAHATWDALALLKRGDKPQLYPYERPLPS